MKNLPSLQHSILQAYQAQGRVYRMRAKATPFVFYTPTMRPYEQLYYEVRFHNLMRRKIQSLQLQEHWIHFFGSTTSGTGKSLHKHSK